MAQGGHYGPPCFFSFGATKSPKLNLGTFLALKTTWKAILNIFRSLSLVTRGPKISIAIILEKFKIFKILSFKGVMYLKWKENMYNSNWAKKVGFVSKKIKKIEIFWNDRSVVITLDRIHPWKKSFEMTPRLCVYAISEGNKKYLWHYCWQKSWWQDNWPASLSTLQIM